MNIQVIGTKKCQNTQKAERFFKERKIPYQFVDLTVRGLSKGELMKIQQVVGLDNMIDRQSKEYAKRNLQYMVHKVDEMLLEYPLLHKTPIVRNGGKVTIGYCPEVWEGWRKGE